MNKIKRYGRDGEFVTYADHAAAMVELSRTIASEEHNEMLTEEECAKQVASIREHVKNINETDHE